MLPHFANQGFSCPRTTNPADFALDLITVDLRHEAREAASRAKVRALISSWSSEKFPTNPTVSISTPAELGSLARSMASFRVSVPLLLHRAALNFGRQPDLVLARIMQVVGLGLVVALFFAPLKNDFYAVQNRLGFVQEIAPVYFVGMLQNVAVYPREKDVFYREFDDRAYSVEAFFLQYTIVEIPFEIVSSLIFAVLADLACGLPRDAETFFVVAYNCFCIVSCGESLGILFNTLFAHTGFAVNVTSVFLSVAQMMSGILSLDIPAFLQAFNYLSPVKYLVGNLVSYAFKGQKFSCEEWQLGPGGECMFATGEQVLKLYNLDKDPKIQLMALGICTILYRFLAYLLLKMVKERWVGRAWERVREKRKGKEPPEEQESEQT
jgi:ABC-type multidrug transport system permease subunit